MQLLTFRAGCIQLRDPESPKAESISSTRLSLTLEAEKLRTAYTQMSTSCGVASLAPLLVSICKSEKHVKDSPWPCGALSRQPWRVLRLPDDSASKSIVCQNLATALSAPSMLKKISSRDMSTLRPVLAAGAYIWKFSNGKKQLSECHTYSRKVNFLAVSAYLTRDACGSSKQWQLFCHPVRR